MLSTTRKIHRAAVGIVREAVKAKPWRLEAEDQLEFADAFLTMLSKVYGVDTPGIRRGYALLGLGCYDPHANIITLDVRRPFSIVTTLHEFRHHMQVMERGPVPNTTELEDDAQSWALSAFRAAAPRRFRRMAAAGRLARIDEAEL